jgi:hypothetical protein
MNNYRLLLVLMLLSALSYTLTTMSNVFQLGCHCSLQMEVNHFYNSFIRVPLNS